ncbi:MAG: hypothetical protein AAF694_06955 [Bacteroidota bacterium]
MDSINGIDFENWAAAAAHLAQGMTEDEICQILGIELPVWQDTNGQWAAKLGDLMAEDMSIATTYGNIFANPKVGKFGHAGSGTPTLQDLLQKVPDFEAYQKIFWQQSIAATHGIDAITVLEENGLNLQTWGQLNMHFMQWNNEYMDSNLLQTNPEAYKKRYDKTNAIREKWEKHWTEQYKDHVVNLSGDIDF